MIPQKAHYWFLLLCSIISIASNAQIIKKLEVETTFGASRVDLEMTKTANPDFLNYLSQEDIIIDAAHFGVLTRFYLENNWEVTFLLEKHVEFAPFLGNFNITKRLKNNWGINLGVSTESFIIGRIDAEYEYLDKQFTYGTRYYKEHSPIELTSFLLCPYIGINYNQNKGRFNFRYTLNTGFSLNQPFRRDMVFRENNSNYLYIDKYKIPINASVFVKPEVYASYKFIDNKNFVLGLRAKLTNYLTHKDLDYTRTHYEWTRHNPTIETVDQPKHWFNCVSFDLGLMYQRK